MKKLFISSAVIIMLSAFAIAQEKKGVDTQNKEIREQNDVTTKTTSRDNDVTRTFSFGKGKTVTRERLDNPFQLNSRRDILINSIISVLKEQRLIVDEAASKFDDGFIVSQPYTFAKGAIITKNELNRYAVIPDTDQIWTRGRYTLTIDVQSIDGIRNKVYVTANVEGRAENGIFSEWSTLQSSGIAEDEFLVKLIDYVGGTKPEGILKPKKNN
ncbi:MAG: hypothetical protein ACR2MD_13380 [Aridibacter sp.]|nr:hypothetical protein [Acidobacteriota bacterium]